MIGFGTGHSDPLDGVAGTASCLPLGNHTSLRLVDQSGKIRGTVARTMFIRGFW